MRRSNRTTRREWLWKIVFWGAVSTGSALLGGILFDVLRAAGRFSPARWVKLAAFDSFAPDAVSPIPDKRIAVIRKKNQLAAINLECTHLGCLVHTMGGGFYCPCHGSEFGPQGEVYSGPATRPLSWHAVEIRNNQLWVQVGEKLEGPMWVHIDRKGIV